MDFVKSLLTPEGAIRACASGHEADLRHIYAAVAYLDMLGIWDEQLAVTNLHPNLLGHTGSVHLFLSKSQRSLRIESAPRVARRRHFLRSGLAQDAAARNRRSSAP